MLSCLLDFFFPPSTPADHQEVNVWVRAHLRPVELKESELARRGLTALHHVAGAAPYSDGEVAMAIHRLKYRRDSSVRRSLCALMGSAFLRSELPRDAIICPVPLHWRRKFDRGFNQAELLAQAVSRAGGGMMRKLLRRRRFTGSQAKRNREERLTALGRAFAVNGEVPPMILLIDDVMTTGSTLHACATALRAAGARQVDALVLAVDE